MFKFLSKIFKPKEKCTHCGKPFSRLEWGGRAHYSSNGTCTIHPIDYVVTWRCKTFKECREAISKLEETEKEVREINKKNKNKFCPQHYLGCPE